MPTFADKFAEAVRQRRWQIERTFSEEPASSVEKKLREGVRKHWHALPPQSRVEKRQAFAVDGSSASRDFTNAATMIISQALAIGPGLEEPYVDVRFLRGNLSTPTLDRYKGLLMRYLEIKAALDNLDRMKGGELYLDGSLYAGLPHFLYPLDIEGEEDLPLRLLKMYLDLFDGCRERDILLLGISKTSRDSVLSDTLLLLQSGRNLIPSDVKADHVSQRLPDVEILSRWAQGAGFSTPVLLGVHSLGHRRKQFLSSSEELAQGFVRRLGPGSKEEIERVLARLRNASAIAAFHVRFEPGEDTLRVDVPASALGFEDRLADFYSKLIPSEKVHPILRRLASDHGGLNVYNAILYIVDQQVRLRKKMVDGPYLSILRNILGRRVEYDRSTRRFL